MIYSRNIVGKRAFAGAAETGLCGSSLYGFLRKRRIHEEIVHDCAAVSLFYALNRHF